MYCDNCHRQSPDNFVNCPYCAAPLKNHKRKNPQKFVKKKERKKPVSFKTAVIITVVIAFVLAVSAVVTGVLTGSKPDTVVKTMVTAIETNDDQIIEYYKENWYYGDEETRDALTEPLAQSIEFYTTKCGENFTLEYKITDVNYLTDASFESCCDSFAVGYNYKKLPKKIALLDFEIEAKGDKGTYKSVYEDFLCAQIGGDWYKMASSTINNENELKTVD